MDDGYCVLHRPELNLSHLSDGLRVPVLIHHQPSAHMQLRAREASLGKRVHVPHKVLVDRDNAFQPSVLRKDPQKGTHQQCRTRQSYKCRNGKQKVLGQRISDT